MRSSGVVSALTFKFIERIAVKAIGFIISVVLARLLEPEVFGITSIILAVVAVLQTFVDGGLGTALIQNKVTSRADYSTVFYMSVTVSAIMYIILYILSPIITTYYCITEYLPHFRVLSMTLLFYSFNSIQIAKLTREMQFRKMLTCQIITSIISGTVGVVSAYMGLGVWALIVYYITHSAISCIAYGYASKWRPEFVFSMKRAKELLSYGYKVLASGLMCSVFTNIRTFIVGRIYTKAELGLYSRGDQIPSVISAAIDGTFNSVMLTVFSREQDNRERIHTMLRKTIAINSYINFPAMFGLAVIAPAIVVLLYTSKWEACVPYLQLLSIANLNISITSPCLIAIKASGHSETYLRLEIVRRTIMLALLGVSLLFHSLIVIAIFWAFSTFVDIFVIIIPTRKLFGYTTRDLFYDVGPTFVISMVMSASIWLISFFGPPLIITLIIQIVLGIITYYCLSACFKVKSYIEFKEVLRSLMRRKKSSDL